MSDKKERCKRSAYQSVVARRITRLAARKVSCFKDSKLAHSRRGIFYDRSDGMIPSRRELEEDVDADRKD